MTFDSHALGILTSSFPTFETTTCFPALGIETIDKMPGRSSRNLCRKRASLLMSCDLAIKVLERFRFDFHYLYDYHNLSFSQSDVPDLPYQVLQKPGKGIVVEEVKSEPL